MSLSFEVASTFIPIRFLFYITIFFPWTSTSLSSNNSIRFSGEKQEMQTLLDFSGQMLTQHTEMMYLAAIIPKFTQLDISFDLEVKAAEGSFENIPILSIEGKTTELTLYVSGGGEFWIMHYNSDLDVVGEKELLLVCNGILMPRILDYNNRYHVKIVDAVTVTVEIGDQRFSNVIRSVSTENDPMDLWLNRVSYDISIKDLQIQSV